MDEPEEPTEGKHSDLWTSLCILHLFYIKLVTLSLKAKRRSVLKSVHIEYYGDRLE